MFSLTHALVINNEKLVGVGSHTDDRTGHAEQISLNSTESEHAHLLPVRRSCAPTVTERD